MSPRPAARRGVPAALGIGAGLFAAVLWVVPHLGGQHPALAASAQHDGVPAGTGDGTGAPGSGPTLIGRYRCPAGTVDVRTAGQLRAALAAALPGQVIRLADGVYQGSFTVRASGTAAAPIYLCGGRAAELVGPSISRGYGLHLDRVAHWRISGFTVRQAQKGVVLDGSTDVGLQDLRVAQIGDEGVHLRRNSVRNVLRGLTVQQVGRLNPKFGEGIYIGTARANWDEQSDGRPDRSDGNVLVENAVSGTTAEAVDVKEGTSSGVIADNWFDGTEITDATAWVNVKGNGWLITGNRGVHTPRDGYATFTVLTGWGERNVFTGNRADLADSTDGVGVRVQPGLGNVVRCGNTTTGDRPDSNVRCVRA